tara:strand:+ start:50 stop:259 length:210 start_codon:yes stop_codon:yes gene_type:complete
MPANTKVTLRRGESSERLIRRFTKKVKKERIIEDFKEKTSHHIKPSVKKKIKQERARRERLRRQRKMRK